MMSASCGLLVIRSPALAAIPPVIAPNATKPTPQPINDPRCNLPASAPAELSRGFPAGPDLAGYNANPTSLRCSRISATATSARDANRNRPRTANWSPA